MTCMTVCTATQAKEGLSSGDIEAALKKMPFKLGGGKTQVSLFEVVPNYAIQVLSQFFCGLPYDMCDMDPIDHDVFCVFALRTLFTI